MTDKGKKPKGEPHGRSLTNEGGEGHFAMGKCKRE